MSDYYLDLPPIPVDKIESDAKRALEVAKAFFRRNGQYSRQLARELAMVYAIDNDTAPWRERQSLCKCLG